MATTVFFTLNPPETHRGTNTAKLNGSTSGWTPMPLSLSRGSGLTNPASNTVTGPTSGIEIGQFAGAVPLEWISPAVDASVTISGTITANLWAGESSMNANVAINVIIDIIRCTDGSIVNIVKSTRTTELGFSGSATVQNFTTGMTSGAYTGQTLNKGDRLRIRVFGDDAGTMATGFTFFFNYSGTTGGADGDSFVTFTENFAFETSTPAGTQLFLTDVAGPAVGAATEKEMWTSRGDGGNTAVVNTAAGWTSGIQWTVSAGGAAIEWYSKRLNAFTLTDGVLVHIRADESNGAAEAGWGAELATCDNDGTNVTVWSRGLYAASGSNDYELVTGGQAVHELTLRGSDLAVADGQRLRLRLFIDDLPETPLVTGHTATLYYDSASSGSSDSYITLTESVSLYDPQSPARYRKRFRNQAVNRGASW